MHEYPVTLEIVRIAENTAREKGGLVKAIHLVVGEDSGFIGESIQMYFDVISEGTLCEGALYLPLLRRRWFAYGGGKGILYRIHRSGGPINAYGQSGGYGRYLCP